ncbi:MAG: DUF2279 domain-containing protein [Bacteroidetes bacterium]|nr:MAG: DUF2279 domain-containing protein [Bacteroidota bacterium]
MKKNFHILISLLLIFNFGLISGQETDSLDIAIRKNRRIGIFTSQAVVVIGSLAYLNQAWYSQFENNGFHFKDDSNLWLQMDKMGHITTMNYLSNINFQAYRWSGYNNKTATWMGFGISYGFMTAVEIMDGFSAGWGFSWGDIAANTIGGGLFVAQQLTWQDQRMIMKFSYHPTEYADMRPEVLGDTPLQRVLKDYNGQTHWLSVNPQSFSKNKKFFPVWLNLAIGYSADGLLGGESNTGDDYDFSDIPRVRQFFFAPDVDFTRIKTRSKFLKGLFAVMNLIKVPAPTLEVDQNGKVQFYWFYF